MANFYPFMNQAGYPWWALFEDQEAQPRQSCSGAARRSCRRRDGPSTSSSAYRQQRCGSNTGSRTCNPEEFLSNMAGTFLPGILEALAAASKAVPKRSAEGSTPASEQSKNVEEFLSTAAAFASTHFPELYEALTGAVNKDGVKPTSASPATLSNKAFEVKLNVSDYTPQELSVKTIGNSIIIDGKHGEKEDGQGFVARSFSRRFVIPDNVKPEHVECKLTSDGFLVLSAPIIVETPVTKERSIPINVTKEVTTKAGPTTAATATPVEPASPVEAATTTEIPTTEKVSNTGSGVEDAEFVVVPSPTQANQ